MKDTATWIEQVEALCSRYETTLQSSDTVEVDLRSSLASALSPVDAVYIELDRNTPFATIHIGELRSGDPTDSEERDVAGAIYRIKIWRKRGLPVDANQIRQLFFRLSAAHWKNHLHDKYRLLSFQYVATQTLLENTMRDKQGKLFLLFTDLDKFKDINDKYGQDAGDEAILQFAALFDSAVGSAGVPIHRSGDEFCAIFFEEAAETALRVSCELVGLMQTRRFAIKGQQLSMSTTVGLTLVPSAIQLYLDLEDLAVRTIKPSTGKQRGKIRFSAESGQTGHIPATPEGFLTALCELKTNVPNTTPFASPALNLLSQKVSGVQFSEIQKLIEKLLSSLTASIIPGLLQATQIGVLPDISMALSPADACLAVAHGIYRGLFETNDLRGVDELIVETSATALAAKLIIMPSNETVFSIGMTEDRLDSFNLGAPVLRRSGTIVHGAARAVLIRIGHGPLLASPSLFADIIVVDDRPTRGGGLPDFWEATIARLIGLLTRNPNVEEAFVLGETEFAVLTIAKLRSVAEWPADVERIAFKTGMNPDAIRDASTRLSGHITFVATPSMLLEKLADALRRKIVLADVKSTTQIQHPVFLERRLLEDPIRLHLGDGCRAATIAEVYPIAIEIVRKTEQSWNAHDESGIALRELTDFKIHLSNPSRDQVPAFYHKEQDLLIAYFKREFLSGTGTFGKIFAETRQMELVFEHLVTTITKAKVPATTRRAILIIPHAERIGEEIAPLGLVCVRIVPRISALKIRFDYSFVWRTVETMVGLPYSLFGSVCFAEHLTNELRQRLSSSPYQVEFGEVSYVAQSLHMFTDEYGQIIARRIVNDATS